MTVDRRYTEVAGYRFHSVHAGSGPPVVLLHGLAGSHRWWRYTVPALQEDFRIHVPELIGFGASRSATVPPGGIPAMMELLLRWLDAQGLECPHVVGHSMGGQISIHLAASRPDRVGRLVLASAAGIPRRRSAAELVRFLVELLPPRAWGRPAFLPTVVRDALRAGPRTILRMMYHILADDVRPLLARIRSPTLLVWGRLDPLTPLSHAWILADGIRGAQLRVIPDAAHNPMADRPRVFNRLILSFLRGVDGGA
ncbi:MAG TPA: alpha/beta fold hydrolase [Longimicrobiales bacterium]